MHQYKCQHPDCNYCAEYITSNHYEQAHGLSKQEMYQLYNEPIKIGYDFVKYQGNRNENKRRYRMYCEVSKKGVTLLNHTYAKEQEKKVKNSW